jgi:hypothetical protein
MTKAKGEKTQIPISISRERQLRAGSDGVAFSVSDIPYPKGQASELIRGSLPGRELMHHAWKLIHFAFHSSRIVSSGSLNQLRFLLTVQPIARSMFSLSRVGASD